MQSPAEFSREHQPAYVPTTNRVLAGFLTMGVYALVLVVAGHRSPAPIRAASSQIASRMAPDAPPETYPEAHQQAVQQTPPHNARADTPQEAPRNAPQNPQRQQSASRQPFLLERLFGPRAQTDAAGPTMMPAPTPGSGGQPAPVAKPSSAPGEQPASAARPAQAEQLASAQSGSRARPSSPSASGQQDATNTAKDKPPPACHDAAWVRAVTNRVHRFFPPAARRPHATGLATARLVIRRSGWLNELEIAGTSGNAALDAAAYTMVRKAQPLPRIPDRIAADRIDLELPIAFGVAGDFKITINNCGR